MQEALWASTKTAEKDGPSLRDGPRNIAISRDGTVPLSAACPSLLGPVGSSFRRQGVVVGTDGAVRTMAGWARHTCL